MNPETMTRTVDAAARDGHKQHRWCITSDQGASGCMAWWGSALRRKERRERHREEYRRYRPSYFSHQHGGCWRKTVHGHTDVAPVQSQRDPLAWVRRTSQKCSNPPRAAARWKCVLKQAGAPLIVVRNAVSDPPTRGRLRAPPAGGQPLGMTESTPHSPVHTADRQPDTRATTRHRRISPVPFHPPHGIKRTSSSAPWQPSSGCFCRCRHRSTRLGRAMARTFYHFAARYRLLTCSRCSVPQGILRCLGNRVRTLRGWKTAMLSV